MRNAKYKIPNGHKDFQKYDGNATHTKLNLLNFRKALLLLLLLILSTLCFGSESMEMFFR